MKNLKKIISLTLTAVIAAGLCTSCNNSAQVPTTDEQGRTIISVGAWPAKEGTSLDNMNKNKESFEAANTDVVIEPDTWSFDLRTFYPKAAAGLLPTLYNTHFTEISLIVPNNYAADLTDVLSKRGYDGQFSERVLDVVSKNGRIYGFPSDVYVLGLAYNTELFEAAGLMEADGTPKQPATWDELVEFAKKIKEATGKPGFVFPTANNNGGWLFTNVAWSFGAEFMKQDENGKWIATFNSPECAQALQFIKDMKWKHNILPANTLIDGDEYAKVFGSGGAAMCLEGNGVVSKVVKYGMKPEQLGMMAMPAGPKRHVTLLGGGVYCVSTDSTEEQIDAAIRWLEHIGKNYTVTEDSKAAQERSYQVAIEEGRLVNLKTMSIWGNDSEVVKFRDEMIDKYSNANPNHVRLYNEFVLADNYEIQAEEPICAQDLYGVLDNCIQAVLEDENVDCAKLLEALNRDFQTNFLDTFAAEE